MNIIGDVHGKTVVLVDDMVDTAGTLCHGAEALIKLGGAKEVYACATHGVLSGPALQRLTDSVITETVFLDTIPAKEGSEAARIKMLSVAPVFAEAISRIYEDKPRFSLDFPRIFMVCFGRREPFSPAVSLPRRLYGIF